MIFPLNHIVLEIYQTSYEKICTTMEHGNMEQLGPQYLIKDIWKTSWMETGRGDLVSLVMMFNMRA